MLPRYVQANHPQMKQETEMGELSLVANGEDFVRQGFVSKDNWRIDFDHVYVTIAEVKAYQTDPAFNPDQDSEINASETVTLQAEAKTIDLADGGADATPILVNTVSAPPGFYNALSWKVVPGNQNSTIVMQGTASKEDQTINFIIGINQPLEYECGEFVGDDRKGILQAGKTSELETTLHFDHIFGDGEAPADDEINTGALGFEPLAALAENGELQVDAITLQEKLSPEDYQTLEKTVAGLGHVGEGHCR